MLTSTPWSLFFFPKQTDLVLLTTLGFFSLSKGAMTSFKPICKHRGQQWGISFHSFLKVPQFSSNLTNVVDNNGV